MKFAYFCTYVICFGILMLLTSACDPCYELAEKICDCEKTSLARENCKRELDSRKGYKGMQQAKNEQVCIQALKECTCLLLEENEIEKCGITRSADTKIGDEAK